MSSRCITMRDVEEAKLRELERRVAARSDLELHVDAIARGLGLQTLLLVRCERVGRKLKHTLVAFPSPSAALRWLDANAGTP